MLACVFWDRVNNFYTNILHTVYIYNHTSHVGRWRKIFFLQCLYSKLLFLHSAHWPALQSRVLYLSEFGVRLAYKHTALPDTQWLLPCTRLSACLHMCHTANRLPACCFSFSPFLWCLSERFPPCFLFPTMHHGLYQQEVKSDVQLHCSNLLCNRLYFTASLNLLYQQP